MNTSVVFFLWTTEDANSVRVLCAEWAGSLYTM